MRSALYARFFAARLHPDLFGDDDPELERVARAVKLRDQTEEVTNFLIDHGDELELDPWFSPIDHWEIVTVYDGSGEMDVPATQRRLARVVKVARSVGLRVEKEYSENHFLVRVLFPSGGKVTFMAKRDAVCERRVTQEWVEPIEGHFEERVSWDCEKVALTALDPEDA